MLTRKTQYAWMALGGLICLLGLVIACQFRDGNKANAQPEPLPMPTLIQSEKKSPTPPAFPAFLQTQEPEKVLPPPKSEKSKEQARKDKSAAPKATLEMPSPSAPPPLPMASSPKLTPPRLASPPILPASFGLNTPTIAEKKAPEPTPAPPSQRAKGTLPAKPDSKFDLHNPTAPLINAPPPPLPAPKSAPPSPPKSPLPDPPTQSTKLPSWNAPATVIPASAPPPIDRDSPKTQPGEPPLAPAPGPVQIYHVHGTETLLDIARRTLSIERLHDVQKLNPTLEPDKPLRSGSTIRLPADACIQADDAEPVKPLPALRPKPPAPKAKTLPLTGTYQCSVDEKGQLTLPRAIRDQFGGCDTVLLSPGPDKCLWLTNQAHLERLGERLDQSRANEADVRVFKRLYFAQTEKLSVNDDGRVSIPERLGQFAGLHQEVVLVGIDDHFEIWDAARWRSYTQQKSAARTTAAAEPE